MKRFKWDRTYLNWGITAFCVIAACILFYMALSYLPLIGTAIRSLIGILSPFIWGLVITYLMLPLTNILDRQLFRPVFAKLYRNNPKRQGRRLSRSLAVVCGIITFLLIVTMLIYLIIPQLYASIKTIVDNSPAYITSLTQWAARMLKDYPEIEQMVIPKLSNMTQDFLSWIQTTVLPGIGTIATNVTAGVISVVKSVYNVVIGIIVSVYVLYSNEHMIASIKRLLYALFPVSNVTKMIRGIKFVNATFNSFISGKIFDSAIIAVICYISCSLLKIPYALLVSTIVGITNIIPFFGPFIGAVPSTLFILMVSPIKALVFVIFIIILQQVDGNIIGPKILGSSVGLNSFWIMFSIIVGAGLFGFWGMLLGVPVFVIIYSSINTVIDKKLEKRGLPLETALYEELDHVDPETLEFSKKTYEIENTEKPKFDYREWKEKIVAFAKAVWTFIRKIIQAIKDSGVPQKILGFFKSIAKRIDVFFRRHS